MDPLTPPSRFPLDLTLNGSPIRVTRAGTDALVYHPLALNTAVPPVLARSGPDIPAAPMEVTNETTDAAIIAHLANPPTPLATAADIKAEAGRRILVIAPIWKQMNMTARTLDLTNLHGSDPVLWPAEAQAERATYGAIYAQIKAIRAASDALELSPPTLADLPAAAWPE